MRPNDRDHLIVTVVTWMALVSMVALLAIVIVLRLVYG